MKEHSRNPSAVDRELIGLQRGGSKKLIFDATTGQLLIGPEQSKSKVDTIVIDQIYQTGFFAIAA